MRECPNVKVENKSTKSSVQTLHPSCAVRCLGTGEGSSWSITFQYFRDNFLDGRGSWVQAYFLSSLHCGYHFHFGTVNSWPEHIHEGDRIEWDSRSRIRTSAAQFKIWVHVIRFSNCKRSQSSEDQAQQQQDLQVMKWANPGAGGCRSESEAHSEEWQARRTVSRARRLKGRMSCCPGRHCPGGAESSTSLCEGC